MLFETGFVGQNKEYSRNENMHIYFHFVCKDRKKKDVNKWPPKKRNKLTQKGISIITQKC